MLFVFCCASFVFAAEEAAQPKEPQGIFNGTLGEAIWTIIAFVTLLIVLSRTAWKPLLAKLQAREEHIKHQLSSADIARQKAEKLLEEYKQQGSEIIENTMRHAHQTEKEIIDKAGKEAIAMKQRALSEIQYTMDKATSELWEQLGDIVLSAGHEILGRSITTDDNKRLVSEAIGKLKKQQMEKQK